MLRYLTIFCSCTAFGVLAAVAIVAIVFATAFPKIPEVSKLLEYQPKMPLRIMTADGVQIAEFGRERRKLVEFDQVPKVLIKSILAAEDDRFFKHQGIDINGILRSAINNILKGSKAQGGSTITMQVARNFYLSSEKTFIRKIYEVLLALEIERKLSKKQILELYINQIYLGKRAYGFASAAQIYFAKPLGRINIAEAAMLAGLPKAPSAFNPYTNLRRATLRQRYVLGRLYKLGNISLTEYQKEYNRKLIFKKGVGNKFTNIFPVKADHLAEMVRQQVFSEFGENTYNLGLTVFTTIRADEQRAAHMALRKGILQYDKKNGYRGPEGYIKLSNDPNTATEAIADKLSSVSDSLDILACVVTKIEKDKITVSRGEDNPIILQRSDVEFAEIFFSKNTPRVKRIRRGSIVRIKPKREDKNKYELTQLPNAEAAIVALQTNNGAIRALVGGFDFQSNKYNRVTQAYRQPGSSIKPFIFGAALEKGFSPKTIINDLPVNFNPFTTGGTIWTPKNFNNLYLGPISMKEALTKSQNMVSIRIVKKITPSYAQNYISRFGFEPERNPALYSLALGAGSITPLQLVAGYSSIANGGFYTKPYFIDRILDYSGKLVRRYEPLLAGDENTRIIDPRHAYILHNMLSDVVYSGTAKKAKILERPDLAGKTGTTNDAIDAWFAGYQPNISAVTWFGYDNPQSLGEKQTGSGIALPIWIDFMREVLKRQPIVFKPEPSGIIRINDGLYTHESLPNSFNESLDVNDLDVEENF
ncbi:MAG: hypothetical protein CBD16_05775 [Betaproteobacteria bacterium TMED156]|nr:MAG: hypothetical protein CBD16_05775 [Betaproteobacteria bacterium TMED156]